MVFVPGVAVEWFDDLGLREEILRCLEGLKVGMLEAALWLSKPRRIDTMVSISFEVMDGRIPLRVDVCPHPGGVTEFSLVSVERGETLGLIHLTPLDTYSNADTEEKLKALCRLVGIDYEDIL